MAQVVPELPPEMAAHTLWRSVEEFGEEGSPKKERGIARAILSA
ncbi:MAG: hypothetical protein ACE5KY_05450 [Candidatus Tectimicrobiota bacterium]